MPTTNQSTGLGPDAKININNIPFAVVGGRYRWVVDKVDTSDSQSGPGKTNKTGLGALEMSVNAHQDSNVNPHQTAGLNLNVGALVSIVLDVFGNGSLVYSCPTFRILDVGGDFTIQGSQAQNLNISGESSGNAYISGNLEV